MGLIPQDFVDSVQSRTDIAELIGSRVKLKRSGREYAALCPFHDEDTPSFTVSPQKQFYHCFGCGAHGGPINFLMEYDGLTFPDAVEVLAERLGLQVPKTAVEPDDDRQALQRCVAAAQGWFATQLGQSSQAQDYLARRHLDAVAVERFELGFAPDRFDGMLKALGSDPRRRQLLLDAGLLKPSERGGNPYDTFRGRLMFPISDLRGRPLAFGGRIIGDGQPKYLNSPETKLFHKGDIVYNLHRARAARDHEQPLLVVEGYMDVIALAQHGFESAVATMGTAIAAAQVERLFRARPTVVYCFDGDNAGRRAAWRALTSTLQRLTGEREARFLFLPQGEDPDSLVNRHGANAFEQSLGEALPLSQVFFDLVGEGLNRRRIEDRAKLVAKANPLIESMPPGTYRQMLTEELALRERHVTATAPSTSASRVSPAQHGARQKVSLVRSAVTLVLQHPQAAAKAQWLGLELLDLPGIDVLRAVLEVVINEPNLSTQALLDALSEHPQHGHLMRLAALPALIDTDLQRQELDDVAQRLHLRALEHRIAELESRFDALDANERVEWQQLRSRRIGVKTADV